MLIGKTSEGHGISEAISWLLSHRQLVNVTALTGRLRGWRRMRPNQVSELILLVHAYSPDTVLAEMASDNDVYKAPNARSFRGQAYVPHAAFALLGLSMRTLEEPSTSPGIDATFLQILRTLTELKNGADLAQYSNLTTFLEWRSKAPLPQEAATWPKFASLARCLAIRLAKMKSQDPDRESAINALNSWADTLERAIATKAREQTTSESQFNPKTPTKRSVKRNTKRK